MGQYLWSTLAGARTGAGFANGPASSALFDLPRGVAVQSGSNPVVYVADSGNALIRRVTITQSGTTVDTLAGQTGVTGTLNGSASIAQFNLPSGVAVDGSGAVYVADTGNNTIRKITFSGTTATVSTLAGNPGVAGSVNGQGSSANFYAPTGVAVDASGNVFVADSGNHAIRKITPAGLVTTLAGLPGVAGVADGTGPAARFFDPIGLMVDGAGNVLVADSGNNIIRKVTQQGLVTTIAGGPGLTGTSNGPAAAARFFYPTSIGSDTNGNLYVTDFGNETLRVISSGTVSTLAGSPGIAGATSSLFNGPIGLAVSNGSIYVADSVNAAIRQLSTSGTGLTTLAGNSSTGGSSDGPAATASFNRPNGVALDGSNNDLLVTDVANDDIRFISASGTVSTVAGLAGVSGTADGTGTSANFSHPTAIVATSSSNFFIADTGNNTIRRLALSSSGIWTVTTIAGSPGVTGTNDGVGVSGTQAALFNAPSGIAYDGSANLFVADTLNNSIRAISLTSTAGYVVNTVAGGGTPGFQDGYGTGALFSQPTGIVADQYGDLFIVDSGNNAIRTATYDGLFLNVNTAAISGQGFTGPASAAVDILDNLFITDPLNSTVSEVPLTVATTSTLTTVQTVTTVTTATTTKTLKITGTATTTSTTSTITSSTRTGATVVTGTPNVIPDGFTTVLTSATVSGSFATTGTSVVSGTTTNSNYMISAALASGTQITIGGVDGSFELMDGEGSNALFYAPTGITADTSLHAKVYVADTGNNRIVKGIPSPAISVVLANSNTTLTGTSQAGFGVLPVSVSDQLTFTIQNMGISDLSGLTVTVTGTNASDFVASHLIQNTLIAGGSTSFSVAFTPSLAGPRTATLTIKSNDPADPSFALQLTGTGVNSGEPVISIQDNNGNILPNPGSMTFGYGTVGTAEKLPITVTNQGLGNLNFLSFNVTGPNATDFTVLPPASLTVPPQGVSSFKVAFNPLAPGARQAILHITSTDPVTPSFSIALTGTGLTLAGQSGNFVGLLDNGAGMITLTLASNGQYTGKLLFNGVSTQIFGSLNANGTSQLKVNPTLSLLLHIDLSGTAANPNGPSITGTVNGIDTFATYRASGKKSLAAGSYPVLMDPIDDASDVPNGTSYGTIQVLASGLTTFTGKLADGSAFTFGSPVVGTPGNYQVIVYDIGKNFILSGPIGFSNMTSGTTVHAVCAGNLFWLRNSGTSGDYPNGFNTGVNLEGAAYTSKAASAIQLTTAKLVLTDGTGGPVTPFNPAVAYQKATGIFTGSFALSGTTRAPKYTYVGAVDLFDIQTQAPRAAGFFLAPSISGTYSGDVEFTKP